MPRILVHFVRPRVDNRGILVHLEGPTMDNRGILVHLEGPTMDNRGILVRGGGSAIRGRVPIVCGEALLEDTWQVFVILVGNLSQPYPPYTQET